MHTNLDILPPAPAPAAELLDFAKINAENLMRSGEVGRFLAGVYATALEVSPEVANTVVYATGKAYESTLQHTGGFAVHQEDGDGVHPEIYVDTDDGWGHYSLLLQTRPDSVRRSAEKAGVDLEKVTPQFLAAFIFAHELGHTLDYQTRVPTLEARDAKRAKEMATLPVPGYNPVKLRNFLNSETGVKWWSDNEAAWKALGVVSPAELYSRQDDTYRGLDSEDFADQFAVRVLGLLPFKL